MTEAIDQHRHRGITDPDQAWILGELIAYLDNERSGASGFADMGDKWVTVRDAARAQTLRANDAGAREVAGRWEEFIQWLALGLRQDLGREVSPVWPKKLDGDARRQAIVKQLAEAGRLEAAVKVLGAIAPVDISVDLRTRLVTTSVDVVAPREGRSKTRVTWLLRQLRDAPPNVRIDATFPLVKESTSSLLKEATQNPDRSLMQADARREPRAFKVALARDMGTERGRNQGSFVGDSKLQVLDFYRLVVQALKPWASSAPKLPHPPEEAEVTASTRPPDFSAETREPGEGVNPSDT